MYQEASRRDTLPADFSSRSSAGVTSRGLGGWVEDMFLREQLRIGRMILDLQLSQDKVIMFENESKAVTSVRSKLGHHPAGYCFL